MSIWTSQSYKRKQTQGPYTCLSYCKMSQCRFSFSYCNFLTTDKKKLQMRSFLHVELAYDVAMRRYIIHQSYIRTTHKTDHKILSGWMGYRQCFLWGWWEIRFQMHDSRCTEILGTEISWPWAFIKLSKVYLHSVCWSNIRKTRPNIPKRGKLSKGSNKVLSTNNSFHLHILHATRPTNKMNMDKRSLNTIMTHILYASYDDEPFNSCSKAFKWPYMQLREQYLWR